MILRWMFWILGWAAALNLDALCISGDCIQCVGTMLWQGEISQYSGSWRKGNIIAIVTEGNSGLNDLADHIIEVPETEESLSPLINTIPLQLLSYHIAVMRGCKVDQPRNLAKSVTVE